MTSHRQNEQARLEDALVAEEALAAERGEDLRPGDADQAQGQAADASQDQASQDQASQDEAAGDPAAPDEAAGDPAAQDEAAGDPAAQVAAALAAAQRERDDYLDALRRERAEFDNFRKRTARERLQALDRGAEQVVAKLLGVLDNLSFALAAAVASEDTQLAKGVQMVAAELFGVLNEAGLQEVPGVGSPFDPELHEAVAQEEAEEPVDEPVVVEVLRAGYRFNDRLLRPAAVKVAK